MHRWDSWRLVLVERIRGYELQRCAHNSVDHGLELDASTMLPCGTDSDSKEIVVSAEMSVIHDMEVYEPIDAIVKDRNRGTIRWQRHEISSPIPAQVIISMTSDGFTVIAARSNDNDA